MPLANLTCDPFRKLMVGRGGSGIRYGPIKVKFISGQKISEFVDLFFIGLELLRTSYGWNQPGKTMHFFKQIWQNDLLMFLKHFRSLRLNL